jgi:hypothetical protein
MNGLAERMEYIKKAYRILIGKSEVERPFGRPEHDGKKCDVHCKNHRNNLNLLIG